MSAARIVKGANGVARAKVANDAIPRAAIAKALQGRIRALGLSRNDAATKVGDAASQLSRLMTGHINDFSADRLVKMLLRLGSSVEIVVRHGVSSAPRGRVTVREAHVPSVLDHEPGIREAVHNA